MEVFSPEKSAGDVLSDLTSVRRSLINNVENNSERKYDKVKISTETPLSTLIGNYAILKHVIWFKYYVFLNVFEMC